MIIRDFFAVLTGLYRTRYSMPVDCRMYYAQRNVRRLRVILTLILAFGVIMCALTALTREARPERFFIAMRYYSLYIAVSLIPLSVLRFLPACRRSFCARTYVVYSTLTALQALSIYQKTLGFQWEGYLVWTIAAIVILAIFTVNPLYFTLTMLLQFAYIVWYESGRGQYQFLNLGLLVVVTVLLSFSLWDSAIRDFRNMMALKAANDKSDELLHNILPDRVVTDLRERGRSDPERFEHVSILFTDLVDFTGVSGSLEPEVVIGELSDMFCGFDCIIEKYDCTRIKTIGDAYLAVCGLPESDPDHARKIVQAGLECLEYLKARNEHSPIKWRMRVGVHTGPVVAGIVGVRKYMYDIFGDSVNIASRMENASEEMKVNVSESTWKLVHDSFLFQARDPQFIKGKGIMNMYYVDGSKPGYQT